MKTEQKRGRKLGETFKNGYREKRRFFTYLPKGKKVYYMNYYDINGRRHVKTTKETDQHRADSKLEKIKKSVFANEINVEIRKTEEVEFRKFADEFIENYSKKKKYSWKSDK